MNSHPMVKNVALVLLGGIVLAGCQAPTPTTPITPVAPKAEAVSIIRTICGSDPALDSMGVQLIRSQEQFDALGPHSLGDAAVNFDDSDLVVLSLGQRQTGGYWTHITAIQQVGATLYVQGKANAPAADAQTTQAIEYPYCAAVIAKTSASEVSSQITSVTGKDQRACAKQCK